MSVLDKLLATPVPTSAAVLADVLRSLGCDVDTIDGRAVLVYPPVDGPDTVRGVDVARFAERMPPCVKTVADLHLHLRIEGMNPRVDGDALQRALAT